MNKAIVGALLILSMAVLPTSAAVVTIGDHYIFPNHLQPQVIEVLVRGGETTQALQLNAAIGDSGLPESDTVPKFAAWPDPINDPAGTGGQFIPFQPEMLDGTVWTTHDLGTGAPVPTAFGGRQVLVGGVTSDDPITLGGVATDAVLVKLLIDTEGIAGGTWALNLSDPYIGATYFDSLPAASIVDGSITLVDTTLNTVASGNWNAETTWDNDPEVPYEGYMTAVGNYEVTVAADGTTFELSMNNAGGKVAVNSDVTLTTLHDVDLAAGTLQVGPRGVVDVGDTLNLGAGSTFLSQLNGPDNGVANATGGVTLDASSTLALQATDKLLAGLLDFGDETRTIINGTITGTFDTKPENLDHLGYGVFATDDGANSQVVTYAPNSVSVDVFQAIAGDTDGDRDVDISDIMKILAEGRFGDGPVGAIWPEGNFDGDLDVDISDIMLILATGKFDEGSYANSGMIPAADVQGDAQLLVTADGLVLDTQGATLNGYTVESAAGIFTGEDPNQLGIFWQDDDNLIGSAFGFELAGTHLLGDVIGNEFAGVDLLQDLTLSYTISGTSGFHKGTIVVPEPSTLLLLANGALALLWLAIRRRRGA